MDSKQKTNKVNVINELATSNIDPGIRDQLIDNMIDDDDKEGEGLMDKVFGSKHPELYIVLMIGVFILIAGGVCTYIFRNNVDTVMELWNIFIPALTLIIGYVVGNKKS